MSYRTIFQKIEKTLNQNKQLALDVDSGKFDQFRGLPFYNWDKSKNQQQDTLVGKIGLPVKNGIEHPLYDYEKRIIDYLETEDNPNDIKNKHLYILKSSGLGITTLLLYYIGWRCTRDNDWSGSRVSILTAPCLELTIDLIDRLKALFMKNHPEIQFPTKNTVCYLSGCKVEAFPSHLGLRSMRGLVDTKMIICDEASFFNLDQTQEVRDTLERNIGKTDPIIVLCSTPGQPSDLMDQIRQEPEDTCIYHRMYLSYKTGLNKVYSEQEIERARASPSFSREFNLQFLGNIGNAFKIEDIDVCIADTYNPDTNYSGTVSHWMGIDGGFGSSKTAITIVRWMNSKLEVVYAEEFEHILFSDLVKLIRKLVYQYPTMSKIFVDGSSASLVGELRNSYGEKVPYHNLPPETIDNWIRSPSASPLVVPLAYNRWGKKMTANAIRVLEHRAIRIDKRFNELITALRTCTLKDTNDVDKKAMSNDDTIDAFKQALLCVIGTVD